MRNETSNVTNREDLTVLTFVGGPFDGFEEAITLNDELPGCIALPLNNKAERIFGIQFCRSKASRVAVYLLSEQNGKAAYHFHGMRRA